MKSEKTGMPFWKNEKWKKFSSQNFGIASLRNLRKDQLLILLLVGILLMVIAVPVKNTSKNGSSETYDTGTSDESGFSISGQGSADMTAYTKNLEQRLAQAPFPDRWSRKCGSYDYLKVLFGKSA